MLEYFHSSTKETANRSSSGFIKKLDEMLAKIKNNPEFGGEYMSYQEAMYTERKTGWQEGMQEGIKEGKRKGKAEERALFEKRLRDMGMPENEIKKIMTY